MRVVVITEQEYRARAFTPAVIHPLCALLRPLRQAAGLSLAEFEHRFDIPAVVVAAYERGDRMPPLSKLEAILTCYGYRLTAQPNDASATRLPEDIVGELRAIADQLEAVHPVPADGLTPTHGNFTASQTATDG